jgi:CSLREA domain-containing protein
MKPGQTYFATVRATNGVGVQSTATSDGVVVANSVVNSTADELDFSDTTTSLREAILCANPLPGNTITFDPSVFGTAQTINLTGGPLELTDTTGMTTITGALAGVTVSTGGQSRVFQIDANVSASLSGLTIRGGGNVNQGGGVYNVGSTTLTNCTVSGNSATSSGGGIFNLGKATLTNCTISGNSVSSSGGGLTLYNAATLTNCTISGNIGGGLDVAGAVTLTNTIVAGQTSGGDVIGALAPASSHDLIGGNPLLAPLANYGGPTQTMALLPGSPAIDAGIAAGAPGTDQRGVSRLGNVDIGAFESSGFTIAVSSGSGQTAGLTIPFAAPLAVTVTPNNASEPVDGGRVTFNAPSSGASATLSGSPATIANGAASVSATANGTAGSYQVPVSTSGMTNQDDFSLINAPPPKVVAFRVLYGNGKSYDLINSSRVDVPWLVTGVEAVFNEAVYGTSASLVNSSGALPISGFSGNGSSTLRWTFQSALATADIMAQLIAAGSDQIHDAAGNALDGDGVGGDAFAHDINVLYGDFNDDGVVTLADALSIRSLIGGNNIFADLNGDGQVDVTDVNIARSRLGARRQ